MIVIKNTSKKPEFLFFLLVKKNLLGFCLALKKTIKHARSLEFWRLFAFIGKRLIGIAKLFAKLPFPFIPVLYLLHFLRAILRVTNYFYNTKNKNLGETRKFLFSIFKIIISIVVFALCFFMPVPTVLLSLFLTYSFLKLIDSVCVLFFSVVMLSLFDKHLPENRWRGAQYENNIKKHMSILTPGVAMTLLMSIILFGGVSNIVWVSPIILTTLIIIAVVTVIALAHLAANIYKRCANKLADENPKYNQNIKNFAKIFTFWLTCCTLVGSCFLFLPGTTFIPITAFLLSLYVYDIFISCYYYFKQKSEHFEIADYPIKNNVLETYTHKCYYASRNPFFFLKKSATLETNYIALIKTTLVYVHELKYKLRQLERSNKLFFFLEQSKLKIKIKYLLFGLAKTLHNENKGSDYLIALLIKVKKEFEDETQQLECRPLNLNTLENINHINSFKKDLDELIQLKKNFDGSAGQSNNVLLDLFLAYSDSESLDKDKQPPSFFHQSFFRSVGTATLFWQAFEYCRKTYPMEKQNKNVSLIACAKC